MVQKAKPRSTRRLVPVCAGVGAVCAGVGAVCAGVRAVSPGGNIINHFE